jgi:hypothetical protein
MQVRTKLVKRMIAATTVVLGASGVVGALTIVDAGGHPAMAPPMHTEAPAAPRVSHGDGVIPRVSQNDRLRTARTRGVDTNKREHVSAGNVGSATVGGVDVTSSANFTSCEQKVYVQAMSHEPVLGNYTVFFRAYVYDYTTGQWNRSNWYRADGITEIWLHATRPYRNAYVEYARQVYGGWQYNHEYVPMSESLDSGYSAWGC